MQQGYFFCARITGEEDGGGALCAHNCVCIYAAVYVRQKKKGRKSRASFSCRPVLFEFFL